MGPALTSHMVDIYATQIAFEEKMREIGPQQEATRFKSKQKVRIYNFQETVSEFEGFTQCRDINYGQQGKGNVYTRDFERQHVILKAEQGQPRCVKEARDAALVWTMWTCGQCGGVDSRNTERPQEFT